MPGEICAAPPGLWWSFTGVAASGWKLSIVIKQNVMRNCNLVKNGNVGITSVYNYILTHIL